MWYRHANGRVAQPGSRSICVFNRARSRHRVRISIRSGIVYTVLCRFALLRTRDTECSTANTSQALHTHICMSNAD